MARYRCRFSGKKGAFIHDPSARRVPLCDSIPAVRDAVEESPDGPTCQETKRSLIRTSSAKSELVSAAAGLVRVDFRTMLPME